MTLPEHLKIGFEIYRVGIQTGEDCNEGECHVELGTMQVASRLTPRRRAARLLHEVLHACWDQAELPTNDETCAGLKEEDIVARLSSVLTAVLLDNPALRRAIEGAAGAANSTGYSLEHAIATLKRLENKAMLQRGSEPRSEQPCLYCARLTDHETGFCAKCREP